MTDRESFPGVIARTYAESREAWPQQSKAPEGAPDVIFLVLDDVGYSDLGCYGSEIDTPVINRLARDGLQYTNFHVTSMCSPTRTCLLTGRNAHSVGMGVISEWAAGFPGYRGQITRHAAIAPEILREHAYSTLAVGKWHLTPPSEVSAAGPYQNWPLGRGFDRWYGFQSAFTDQWHPELYQDNHPVDIPVREDYHLTEDLIDRSIRYIENLHAVAPARPYFLYLALGACHWPHHVPAENIAKYKARYAAGWDEIRKQRYMRQKEMGVIPEFTVLPPTNPGVTPWEELSLDDRKFCERTQELFAGFIEHTDQQIGRLITYLESRGRLENTLIVLLSDNGASPEGGPLGMAALDVVKRLYHGPESSQERSEAIDVLGGATTYPHYGFGWAQVSNTPLRWYKSNTYGGGVRAPLLVHWPEGIKQPGRRAQYHHAIDILPTLLDVLEVKAPSSYQGFSQIPLEGTSMKYSFEAPDAPTRKCNQFFEMLGDRAIWEDGWKAVTHHQRGADFQDDEWALYCLDQDFSECHDLAKTHPQKLQNLIDLWWREAEAQHALPLDDNWPARMRAGTPFRASYALYPVLEIIPRPHAPDMTGRSYRISAEIDIPESGAEGVLVAFGSSRAGWVLYVKDGKPVHEYVYSREIKHVATSNVKLASGHHRVAYEFNAQSDSAGEGALFIDGVCVASVNIPKRWPNRAIREGLTCGRDSGLAVSGAYCAPFIFTGTLYRVDIEVAA